MVLSAIGRTGCDIKVLGVRLLIKVLLRLNCTLQILFDLAGIEIPVAASLFAIAHNLEIARNEIVVTTCQQKVIVGISTGRKLCKIVVCNVCLALGGRIVAILSSCLSILSRIVLRLISITFRQLLEFALGIISQGM